MNVHINQRLIILVIISYISVAPTNTTNAEELQDHRAAADVRLAYYPKYPIAVATRQHSIIITNNDYKTERLIHIQVPVSYEDKTKQSYPVLYVTDADWNFPMIASYVDYLIYNKRIPEMLVVGIENINRNSDFVAPADPNFPESGQQARFLNYLESTLMPQINQNYRTNNFDILLGHSFGGVVTLASLFKQPGLFDAYIAIGTSTWVSDRQSFKDATEYLSVNTHPKAFLYLSHAEFDGGDTVPANYEMWSALQRRPRPGLEVHSKEIADTNHFTAVMPSVIDALDKLYPSMPVTNDLYLSFLTHESTGLNEWLSEQQLLLGERFFPQTYELGLLAIRLATENLVDESEVLSNWLMDNYSEQPTLYIYTAYAAVFSGNIELAITRIKSAQQVAKRVGFKPNEEPSFENMLRNFQAMLERQAESK